METKEYTSQDIELRSEEANAILNTPPPRLLRISNIIMFFITLIILLLSFIVSVPVYSKIPVRIEQLQPSKQVQSGVIMFNQLLLQPTVIQKIYKNKVLAILDSTANYQEIKKLEDLIKNSSVKDAFPFEKINVLNLGTLKKDYINFRSDKITLSDFNLKLINWKTNNLIISNKNGKLYIEVSTQDKRTEINYKIYSETNTKYVMTQLSRENVKKLNKKKFKLLVRSPNGYENKEITVIILNEKYTANNDSFDLLMKINDISAFSKNYYIDGDINLIVENNKVIYYFFPFLKKIRDK